MAEKLIPGMAEDPERRYTFGGRVAHLIAYGNDYEKYPYADAYCGYSPRFGYAWLGSGSQAERDEADRLPLCHRCKDEASEIAEFIAGVTELASTSSAKPDTEGTTT